nr:MAG TPA: hypothetical protein [Caudoviricetes sp.]
MSIELCGSNHTKSFAVVPYSIEFMLEIIKDNILSCNNIVSPNDKHFFIMNASLRFWIFRFIFRNIDKRSLHLKWFFNRSFLVYRRALKN